MAIQKFWPRNLKFNKILSFDRTEAHKNTDRLIGLFSRKYHKFACAMMFSRRKEQLYAKPCLIECSVGMCMVPFSSHTTAPTDGRYIGQTSNEREHLDITARTSLDSP